MKISRLWPLLYLFLILAAVLWAASSALASATAPDFTISGTSITLAPGATTGNTSTVTVMPVGGFTGNVALTAAVTSAPANAVFPPALSFGSTTPVDISSTNAGTAVLTISTTAPVLGHCSTSKAIFPGTYPGAAWYSAVGASLACVLLFGIPARRRSLRTILGLLLLLMASAGGATACGGVGKNIVCNNVASSGTTAGNYTVTITGTSGATTPTGTVALTVQ